MPETKALSEHVRAERIQRNETQEMFAEHCGLSTDEISNIENEKTDPRLSTLKRIAAYVGGKVSDLVDY